MRTQHERLKQDVLKAIEKLFNDKSVPLETTLESLEEINEVVEGEIECCESDIEAGSP